MTRPGGRRTEQQDAAPEPVVDAATFLVDAEGVIASWTPAVERLLGWPESEFRGLPFAALFTPEDSLSAAPLETLERARAEGQSTHRRWHVQRGGTRLWALTRTTSVVEKGRHAGFIVALQDATEPEVDDQQKYELAELRRRVNEFETLLDVIPIGIGIARDPEARDIRVNGAFAALLRLPREANASLSAPPEERPEHFRVLRDGRELAPEELPLSRRRSSASPSARSRWTSSSTQATRSDCSSTRVRSSTSRALCGAVSARSSTSPNVPPRRRTSAGSETLLRC